MLFSRVCSFPRFKLKFRNIPCTIIINKTEIIICKALFNSFPNNVPIAFNIIFLELFPCTDWLKISCKSISPIIVCVLLIKLSISKSVDCDSIISVSSA